MYVKQEIRIKGAMCAYFLHIDLQLSNYLGYFSVLMRVSENDCWAKSHSCIGVEVLLYIGLYFP